MDNIGSWSQVANAFLQILHLLSHELYFPSLLLDLLLYFFLLGLVLALALLLCSIFAGVLPDLQPQRAYLFD